MVRTTVIPNKSNFNIALNLPMDYVGEEVEIIAFKKEEGRSGNRNESKQFSSFETIKIDTSNFKFDREDANER